MKFAKPPYETPARPNVLVYGPEKSGKTAGATSARGGTLLLNTDLPNATRYARSRKRDPEGRILEIELPPFMSWEDAQKAGVSKFPVLDLMGEISNTVADPRQNTVEAVVIDPVGELYRRLLEEQSNRSLNATLQHRLAVTSYIERFCHFLCEVPTVSAVFVCHEMMVDRSEEETEVIPFTGSKTGSQSGLGPKLRGMVDIIAYTGIVRHEDDSKTYECQLINEKGRRGGDRYDCLGDMRVFDLGEWFEAIGTYEQSPVVSTSTPAAASPPPAEENPTPDPPIESSVTGSSKASGSPAKAAK